MSERLIRPIEARLNLSRLRRPRVRVLVARSFCVGGDVCSPPAGKTELNMNAHHRKGLSCDAGSALAAQRVTA